MALTSDRVHAVLDSLLTAQLRLALELGATPSTPVDGDSNFKRAFHVLLSPAHKQRYFHARFATNASARARTPVLVGDALDFLRDRRDGSAVAAFQLTGAVDATRRSTGRSTLRSGPGQFTVVRAGTNRKIVARMRDADTDAGTSAARHAFVDLRPLDVVCVELHTNVFLAQDVVRQQRVTLEPNALMTRCGFTATVKLRDLVTVGVSASTTLLTAKVA